MYPANSDSLEQMLTLGVSKSRDGVKVSSPEQESFLSLVQICRLGFEVTVTGSKTPAQSGELH
jgi:hypothetical protein